MTINSQHNYKRATVALLTDFGIRDHYVGTMKGILCSYNPLLTIIDISHTVTPMNIDEAGYLLWASYKYFPKGTMFLVVVDPGVGTSRKIVCLKTYSYLFVAPNNGVLNFLFWEEKNSTLFEIELEKCKNFLPVSVSSTFHGRDIFAPIIGYLSQGNEIESIAKQTDLPQLQQPFVFTKEDAGKEKILHIDVFGNIITNIRIPTLENAKATLAALSIQGKTISDWSATYGDAKINELFLYVGSSELVEIGLKDGSAARVLNINSNTLLKAEWK